MALSTFFVLGPNDVLGMMMLSSQEHVLDLRRGRNAILQNIPGLAILVISSRVLLCVRTNRTPLNARVLFSELN